MLAQFARLFRSMAILLHSVLSGPALAFPVSEPEGTTGCSIER